MAISLLVMTIGAGFFAWAAWKLLRSLVLAMRHERIKASFWTGEWFFKAGFAEAAEFARADQPVAFWAFAFTRILTILLFSAIAALLVWVLILDLVT